MFLAWRRRANLCTQNIAHASQIFRRQEALRLWREALLVRAAEDLRTRHRGGLRARILAKWRALAQRSARLMDLARVCTAQSQTRLLKVVFPRNPNPEP